MKESLYRNGDKVHIEDFAQIFGVYPEKKYSTANYCNIAEVISREAWKTVKELPLEMELKAAIERHLKIIPLWTR